MSIELKIPEVGESVQEVYIVRWFKQEGEHVEEDEDLVELESEKASLEIPAPTTGVIEQILFPAGETVRVGETIALIRESDEDDQPERPAAAEPHQTHHAEADEPDEESAQPDSAADARHAEEAGDLTDNGDEKRGTKRSAKSDDDGGIAVTPSARRELLKHGLQARDVPISGKRLRRSDVEQFVRDQNGNRSDRKAEQPAPPEEEAAKPATPAEDASPQPSSGPGQNGERDAEQQGNDERWVPLSPIRRRIAERLVRGQHEAALLTTFNEIDMSAVIELRRRHQERFQQKHGVKLGFMSFFVRATTAALAETPELNAEIHDEHIVYRQGCHVGVAVGTSKGLLVPVLRNAQQLGFADIERTIQDFAQRAEAGKLRPDDLQGGTFTISNGGVYGSLLSTPLINPPQSGVLGMHTIQQRPVGVDGQIVLRPMMYIALTYDHRLVDGREAVTFLAAIKQAVEDPTRLLLDN